VDLFPQAKSRKLKISLDIRTLFYKVKIIQTLHRMPSEAWSRLSGELHVFLYLP